MLWAAGRLFAAVSGFGADGPGEVAEDFFGFPPAAVGFKGNLALPRIMFAC